jgi:hypothetical protein
MTKMTEASDKGYLGLRAYEDYSHKQVPTVVHEQQKALGISLGQFPEFVDADASKGLVETVSDLPRFKHMNMNTLAAAIIYMKRYKFDYKDPTNNKFGELMGVFGFPWHDKKGTDTTCVSCRREENVDHQTPWCHTCVTKFLNYKLDIIRYLRMLDDNKDFFADTS